MLKQKSLDWDLPGLVAGMDEAGRGPCAGPLVVAAVILKDPFSKELSQVKDSKELTEAKREQLFEIIIENCKDYSYKLYSRDEIIDFIISNYPQYVDLYSLLDKVIKTGSKIAINISLIYPSTLLIRV